MIYLDKKIFSSNFLQASLFHRSARHESLEVFSKINLHESLSDSWECFGESILRFYAARLTLNQSGIKKSSTCSIMASSLKNEITEQINKIVKESMLVRFGPGITDNEKNDLKTYTSISRKLIGAYAHEKNIDKAISDILKQFIKIDNLNITSEKDSKTSLQEYSQKKYHKPPTYELISVSGPQHEQIFEVAININGKIVKGVGGSKKIAEKNAAENFINENKITSKKPNKLNINNFKIYKNSIIKLQSNFDKSNLHDFCSINRIPLENINILALACKHRSSSILIENIDLGRDNTVLAFIGARVLETLTYKNTLPKIHHEKINSTGGISNIVARLIANSSISKHYNQLSVDKIALLGNGEKTPHENLKAEFIQAIIGALYLNNEECNVNHLLGNDISFIDNLITLKANDDDNNNDESLFSKMRLQEKCQSLGLKINYSTKVKDKKNGFTLFSPTIKITSNLTKSEFIIDKKIHHDSSAPNPKFMKIESELAIQVKPSFDIFFSEDLLLANADSNSPLNSWLWKEVEGNLFDFKNNKNLPLRNRLKKANFLGLGYLMDRDFIKFEKWNVSLHSLFKDKIQVTFIEKLKNYYEESSPAHNKTHINHKLKNTLYALENELKVADPLNISLNLRKSKPFIDLINIATSLKLKSNEVKIEKISNIIYEFNLLNKKNSSKAVLEGEDFEVLEIKGTHLTLLDQIVKESDNNIIKITKKENHTILRLEKKTTLTSAEFYENPIIKTLHDLLPITQIQQNHNDIDIHTSSYLGGKERERCLLLWWSFINQGDTVMSINELIASMLHSIKNDILGFTYSSAHALKEESVRIKYQLASEAGAHIDQAISRIQVVKGILSETNLLQIEPLRLDLLIKSIISNIWSWIPNTIIISFPPSKNKNIIWSSQDNLNSIIINLVKNSVDAMNGTGNIDISYSVEPTSSNISFTISDSGPGFSQDQLEKLNAGVSIYSSKKEGQGIGLLTVMLLVKELNGSIRFMNNIKGAIIEVWIPSISDEIQKSN